MSDDFFDFISGFCLEDIYTIDDTTDVQDFFKNLLDISSDDAESIYNNMDGYQLTLAQMFDIYNHADEIRDRFDVMNCPECGCDFIELYSDNPLRRILNIDDEELTSHYCDSCDLSYCSVNCFEEHECGDEEDEEDEEEEDETSDSSSEDSEDADSKPIKTMSSSILGSIIAGIRSDEMCYRKSCAHRYGNHSYGINGKCNMPGCDCTNFITEAIAEGAEEYNALMNDLNS